MQQKMKVQMEQMAGEEAARAASGS